ncbi:hypothetical protein P3H15_55175, partial [Rhodococcus sp. T2V]|nr:hypothetical protein [Rhodococcus sp. T2V]
MEDVLSVYALYFEAEKEDELRKVGYSNYADVSVMPRSSCEGWVWSEPRSRVREYVTGLVAGLERKNGWTLAERAGEIS